jgi:hypothetical protein
MLGAKFDLVGDYAMVKGLPWSLRLTRRAGPAKTPVDLSGCTARLVITDLLDAAAAPLEFSTGSGHVVLGGVAGTVAIDLPGTVTGLAAQRARYRLYLVDALGVESLLLRGRLALVEDGE